MNNLLTTLPDHITDATQRSVLFFESMRQRDNVETTITTQSMAMRLRFKRIKDNN